jgi:hypothetical protein
VGYSYQLFALHDEMRHWSGKFAYPLWQTVGMVVRSSAAADDETRTVRLRFFQQEGPRGQLGTVWRSPYQNEVVVWLTPHDDEHVLRSRECGEYGANADVLVLEQDSFCAGVPPRCQ